MTNWRPTEKLPILEWATKYRSFSKEASALPGRYSTDTTPWIPGILDAIMDVNIREIVFLKASGVSYTEGVINNWLGWKIDQDPSGIIGMFPNETLCLKFMDEKFTHMVQATPRVKRKIDPNSRKKGSRQLYKKFQGGFLSLIGSNSMSNAQSTHLPCFFVDEADRCSTNASGQGSILQNLRDRVKSYPHSKGLIGGTPGVKGFSITEAEYLSSDQRMFYVPCHDCGESHVLNWAYVRWQNDAEHEHEIYGRANLTSACYVCPHCGSIWGQYQKNKNVLQGHWQATQPFNGKAGFGHLSQLYSFMPGASLPDLVKQFLEAEHEYKNGNASAMMAFENGVLGRAFEFKSDAPEVAELEKRELPYKALTVPRGGLLLTAGVDIQSSGRIAVQVCAWGRGEECWVVYFDELIGNVTDKNDKVWTDLAAFLFAPFTHINGRKLYISATSIDASDGNTSDNVYDFVRKHQRRGVMAIKGSSNDYGTKEIFTRPKTSVDVKGKRHTKADRYGLRPYIVGTYKGKDLLYARLKLTGHGPGRIHFHENMRSDYFPQLLAEVKIPHSRAKGKEEYKKKSGQANEALDTWVYAAHAMRSTNFHLKKEPQYLHMENELMQASIFDIPAETEAAKTAPATAASTAPRTKSGWLPDTGDWLS